MQYSIGHSVYTYLCRVSSGEQCSQVLSSGLARRDSKQQNIQQTETSSGHSKLFTFVYPYSIGVKYSLVILWGRGGELSHVSVLPFYLVILFFFHFEFQEVLFSNLLYKVCQDLIDIQTCRA